MFNVKFFEALRSKTVVLPIWAMSQPYSP